MRNKRKKTEAPNGQVPPQPQIKKPTAINNHRNPTVEQDIYAEKNEQYVNVKMCYKRLGWRKSNYFAIPSQN